MKYYIQKTDSLILKFGQYFNELQNELDKENQILTSHTNNLWNKYAELSEKVYSMLDTYNSYAKNTSDGNTLALKDSAESMLSGLESEFLFPSVTADVSVSKTKGFAPVNVTIDFKSGKAKDISEYAASFNSAPPQSFGKKKKIIREYMLKHGVSYWYETSDGSVVFPFTNVETKTVKISPRIRNRAGLITNAPPVTVEMHGKDWRYPASSNSVTHPSQPDSNLFRCIVTWPYLHKEEYYTLGQNNNMIKHPEFYYTSHTDGLTINWKLENNHGLSGYTALPVKHEVVIKQGGKIIYGPDIVPVTQTTLPELFTFNVNGIPIEANTGKPVYAHITALDAADNVLGSSSGTMDIYYSDSKNNLHTQTVSWSPPPLYIDTSPPKLTGEPERVYFAGRSTADVTYKIPCANDVIRIKHKGVQIPLTDPALYEYQLYAASETHDKDKWMELKDSGLVTIAGESGFFYFDFGKRPFEDSLNLVLRAANKTAEWTTGFSMPKTYLIPREMENELPKPAKFHIVGLDENNDLKIEIEQAGSDTLSGVSRYPWRLIQNLYRSKNPIVYIWNPDSYFFKPEDVQPGAVLTIPIPHDSIDVNNSFDVELYTIDRCGNPAVSKKTFDPPPPTPEADARIMEGMHPFTLLVTGPLMPLSDAYVDNLVLRVGTVPDSGDVLFIKKTFSQLVNKSTWNIQAGDITWVFSLKEELPAKVTYGDYIFVSLSTMRGSQESGLFRQRIKIYSPMFETVETGSDGNLVIPITNAAFDGSKEAKFKFAIGKYAYMLSGQNKYQFTTVPFTDLEGVSSADVTPGSRITLPVKAGDVLPRALIGLTAESLDGEKCFTYKEVEITPPRPEVTGSINVKPLDYDRFCYELKLNIRIGSKIQTLFGQAEAVIKVGTNPGLSDIKSVNLKLLSQAPVKFTHTNIYLADSISALPKIYTTVFSKTSMGKVSNDSTVSEFDIPWPETFCTDPCLTIEQEPQVKALRHARKDPEEITGYKFAVGNGSSDTFDLRPYSEDIDIPVSQWKPGQNIILPFSLKTHNYEKYRIGIKAVCKNGTEHENILITKSMFRPVVEVKFIESFPQCKISIKGNFDPEIVERMVNRELDIDLLAGGNLKFDRHFTVPENGSFSQTFDLPYDFERAVTYTFRSSFWDSKAGQRSVYECDFPVPGEPMFNTVAADSEDYVYLDIKFQGFEGKKALKGYQFAAGTSEGKDDIRAFPPDEEYDFTPDQVNPDTRLTLPLTLAGLPKEVYIMLKAVTTDDEIQITSKKYMPRPAMPRVLSLSMDNSGRFTVVFDEAAFDDKFDALSMWIREDNDASSRCLVYKWIEKENITSGTFILSSTFKEEDLNLILCVGGLNLGKIKNSLQFKYRFRIEKSEDGYTIVPLD